MHHSQHGNQYHIVCQKSQPILGKDCSQHKQRVHCDNCLNYITDFHPVKKFIKQPFMCVINNPIFNMLNYSKNLSFKPITNTVCK